MAGVAGKSGGARSGAGRKSLREKYGAKIGRAEKVVADHLAQAAANLIRLADGGFQRIEERYEPAGSILIDQVVRDKEGNPVTGPRGGVAQTKVLAFPDKPADEMVLVERKVITLEADRQANEYLMDRIMGKPVAAIEAEMTGEDGGAILLAFGDSVKKIYAEEDSTGDAGAEGS